MNFRSLFRPSWVAFIGFAPPIVVALILLAISLIRFEPNTMAYVGLAYMLFFPVMLLFGLGVVASTVSLVVAGKREEGIAWPAIALAVNFCPFLSMLRPLLR